MNRIAVAGSVALAFAGALSVGLAHAEAGSKKVRFQNEKDLVVTLVTPTLNQEVLPDLSDPGLNGVVTVHFSGPVRKRDIIDNQNSFNRLRSKVEFFDSTFNRLPGFPTVRRNRFIFNPRTTQNQGVLAQGQYTLNLKRSLRNRRGRLLNQGQEHFTTTFSVGTDVYAPVLRKISPIDGQTNIGLQQLVIATFNEPIEPSSVISSIRVQDASTNPPTAIPGAGGGSGITLDRKGFDVVFTPDPCFGYPPQTTVQFLMQGQNAAGSASPVTDVFGNDFVRDAGLQWSFNAATGVWESPNGTFDDVTGVFRTQFQTKGVRPPPQALAPGSPQFVIQPFAAPCSVQAFFAPSCYATGRIFMYATGTGIGEINLTGFITRFNQGITDFSQLSVIANSPVRTGRPSGLDTDPRWDPTTLHTFIYLVDQRTATIQVLDSRNLQTLGRFAGFSSPRDVSVSTDTARARTTLFVSDFAANNLVGIDLQAITVNFAGQPGAPSVCDAIRDRTNRRTIIPTGRGPTGVSADSYLLSRVVTANTLDSSITVVNVSDNSVRGTFEVGSNPVDLDWSIIGFGAIRAAMIANQGGLNDPDGSISLYLQAPPLSGGFLGAGQNRDGIESTFTDNIKNPTTVWGNQEWLNPFSGNSVPIVWFVPNTGGDDIAELRLNISGLFGVSVTPNAVQTREVGFNPTGAMYDPFYPNAFLFAAVSGTGQFAGMDPNRPVPPTLIRVPGIRKLFTCFTH